jgi:hypothetical protein
LTSENASFSPAYTSLATRIPRLGRVIIREQRACLLEGCTPYSFSCRAQVQRECSFPQTPFSALQLRAFWLILVGVPGERTELDSDSDVESIVATTSPLATTFRCVACKRNALVQTCRQPALQRNGPARPAKKWGWAGTALISAQPHGHDYVHLPVAGQCTAGV